MNVRAFAAVGIVLLLGMIQLSYGGTETRLMGCRGVMEIRLDGTILVYCEGACRQTCAIVKHGVAGGRYPDELQLYDNSVPTFQSPCMFLGVNPDGTEAYVVLP